jgi:hypothetical protein
LFLSKNSPPINVLCELCVSAVSLSVHMEEKPECGFH